MVEVGSDHLQFTVGMDAKLDGAVHNEVHGHRMQALDRESKLVGDAVDDVAQKMIAVDGFHMDGDRVENVYLFLELHGYDAVSKLRCHSNGIGAVTLMNTDAAVCLLESDNFFARDRLAMFAAVVGGNSFLGQEGVDVPLGLISDDMVWPVLLGAYVLVGTYLYAVTTAKDGLDGAELAVDMGILGVHTHLGMNLEGKIQGSGSLR